ncbi:MAG TPA: DUF3105 domain-containing protein [Gaiellaceae bacterium]|jgi:hypothetical protein|nr:DUF3105 domain-containing protein [Gaiellaceae bacterium]HEX2496919.1 DUF3105 domain-containing protein [Gaiellaceae bacterium]
MARKVKTPPPPRRTVQAPKRRVEPRDEGRNRKLLYAIGASGFVMLALVVGYLALGGGGEEDASASTVATLREAGYTYTKPKSQGRDHVPQLAAGFKYNTVPGTSGPHSNQTVVYGTYGEPVSEINYVHNLEHGAVGMFYGPQVPESEIAKMQEYYSEDPSGLILAPDSRLKNQIALTAWTHIAKGRTFDPEVADAFIEEFGFEGPESCKNDIEQGCFRRSNMEPGNQ